MKPLSMSSRVSAYLVGLVLMCMGAINATPDGNAAMAIGHNVPLSWDAQVVEKMLSQLSSQKKPVNKAISDILNEADVLLLLAEAALKISQPAAVHRDLEVLGKCKALFDSAEVNNEIRLCDSFRSQINANENDYQAIRRRIMQVAHLNIGRGSWGPSMEATRRNIEAYKKVLTDVSSVQLPKFLDQLLSRGGQEMQRRMLKTLTPKELNKISSKKLIETMTKVYLMPPSEAEGEESREAILAAVEKIAGDASRYEQWVEEQRAIIRELAVIIVKVSMRSKRKVVKGEGEKRDEHPVLKCQALWYELHVAIEEQRWLLTAIAMLEKVIRSLMGGPAEVPNDLALCGKAVELIERSVREKRVWSGEGQKRFIAKMELLRRWTEEVRGTFVTAEVEAVDFADGLPVSMQNPDLLLAVRYLVQEAGRLVETRLRMKECVELVRDIKGRKKAVGGSVVVAMNRALAIADVIEKLSRTSTKGLVEHAVSFRSDQDGFADSPKGNQMVVATEKLSAHVDAVRALMLDFYGLTSSLDPALELRSRIPGNFFLIDEMERQARDVMEAAEDMEKYVEIKASVTADLAVGSDEFVASGVNGEVADEVKEAQEKFLRMKGDVERVLNAFADVESCLAGVADLLESIKNLGESQEAREHERIVGEYFELRPGIQRALLFAASFESIVLLSREFNEAAGRVRAMAWTKDPEATPEAEPEVKSDARNDVTREAEEANSEAKPETTPDVQPEVEGDVTREAEEANSEAKPETTPDATPELQIEVKPEANSEAKPETTPDVQPEVEGDVTREAEEANSEAKPETTPDATPELQIEVKPDVQPEVMPDVTSRSGERGAGRAYLAALAAAAVTALV